MCLPNFMKFPHCLFKILKNQNVADGQMDGKRENSITPIYIKGLHENLVRGENPDTLRKPLDIQ